MTAVLDVLVRNVYTSPVRDYLQGSLELYWFGEARITECEIRTHSTSEGDFVALISARIQSVLSEMVAPLRAPTMPVHDEPMPCLCGGT